MTKYQPYIEDVRGVMLIANTYDTPEIAIATVEKFVRGVKRKNIKVKTVETGRDGGKENAAGNRLA
jgi:hypothetical protein